MVAAEARASGKFERNTPTTNTCSSFQFSGFRVQGSSLGFRGFEEVGEERPHHKHLLQASYFKVWPYLQDP